MPPPSNLGEVCCRQARRVRVRELIEQLGHVPSQREHLRASLVAHLPGFGIVEESRGDNPMLPVEVDREGVEYPVEPARLRGREMHGFHPALALSVALLHDCISLIGAAGSSRGESRRFSTGAFGRAG